jgi:hypothetical protein
VLAIIRYLPLAGAERKSGRIRTFGTGADTAIGNDRDWLGIGAPGAKGLLTPAKGMEVFCCAKETSRASRLNNYSAGDGGFERERGV